MSRTANHAELLARIEAWPLVSRFAFQSGLVSLERWDLLSSKQSCWLWAELKADLRDTAWLAPQHLDHMRDFAWFDGDTAAVSVPMLQQLTRVAERYLRCSGSRVVLGDTDPPEAAERWRWISLELPADILVSALAARHDVEPCSDRVSLASEGLSRVLEKEVANQHVHQSSAFCFPLAWTGLMASAGDTHRSVSDLASRHELVFGSDWLAVLRATALTRVVLGRVLMGLPLPRALEELSARRGGMPSDQRLIWEALGTLRRGSVSAERWAEHPSGADIALIYRRLQPPSSRVDTLADLIARDPLGEWFPPAPSRALPETRFAAMAMRALRDKRVSADFETLFWQYERIRCQFFRHMTQRPGPPGFVWFRDYFSRLKPYRLAFSKCLPEAALRTECENSCLDSFEGRISSEDKWQAFDGQLKGLAKALSERAKAGWRSPSEVGFVVHFPREPMNDDGPVRHGAWLRKQMHQARALSYGLSVRPDWLRWIRGVDLANIELAQPIWVALPVLSHVREASERASVELRRRGLEVPPFRATVHVAEDFIRLPDGLRRIHELIEFDVLRLGDRIGHGIALGEDPDRWAEANPVLPQAAENRLDDLLWELDLYGRGFVAAPAGRLAVIEREADRLVRSIYGGAEISLSTAVEARRKRHKLSVLKRMGVVEGKTGELEVGAPAERMLRQYLYSLEVRRAGKKPVEVRVLTEEVEFLKRAQRWLRALLGRNEITVESNPSSNQVIGAYQKLEDHPVFRMQPLGKHTDDSGPPVLLSVNDDNPIVFATNLADEYAYFYFTLLRRGVTADDALAWIEKAKRNGWRSRFTLEGSAEALSSYGSR